VEKKIQHFPDVNLSNPVLGFMPDLLAEEKQRNFPNLRVSTAGFWPGISGSKIGMIVGGLHPSQIRRQFNQDWLPRSTETFAGLAESCSLTLVSGSP